MQWSHAGKVKQKVSGQFKSGQNRLARLVDILKKQGKYILELMVDLAKTHP